MKDTCKQAIFRKDKKKSQESCRSLERGDQDKSRTGVFQQRVPLIFREGCAAISLLIPFLNPMSSISAVEYSVGLDEVMGPEETGAGP